MANGKQVQLLDDFRLGFALYKVQENHNMMRFRTSASNHFYRQRAVGEGAQAGQRIEVLVSEWWQSVHSEDAGETLMTVAGERWQGMYGRFVEFVAFGPSQMDRWMNGWMDRWMGWIE